MAFFAPATRRASKIAIAAAIMSVGAFGVTAFDAPAYAKKDKKEEKAEAKNSEEFIEAFLPIQEAAKAEGADKAAILQQLKGIEGTVQTADDRNVYGSMLYNTALDLKNYSDASRGMGMMLESGKVPQEAQAQYYFVGGQLAYNAKDYPTARQRLEQAIALGYEAEEAETLIAQTYLLAEDPAGGLKFIAERVNAATQNGETPDDELLEQGFALAYNNEMIDDAMTFATLRARYYPSETTWRNAIGVQRNYGSYNDAELLDLMRLLRAADAMTDARDYADYIDAANFRRLPGEVLVVTQEGVDAGLLASNDAFVSEALSGSKNAAPGLRDDLGALEREARGANDDAGLVLAAADAYLNFGEAATSADLYELALTKPGVDQATALTRLGIAQYEAGDMAAAQATFAKVDGNRKPIANLWQAFISQQMSGDASPMAS